MFYTFCDSSRDFHYPRTQICCLCKRATTSTNTKGSPSQTCSTFCSLSSTHDHFCSLLLRLPLPSNDSKVQISVHILSIPIFLLLQKKTMYTILQKLDVIEQRLTSPTYRGHISTGSTYFIAADDKKWVPANKLQEEAIQKFMSQDETTRIDLGAEKGYFNFKSIGSGQSNRVYAIQDRSPPHVFREIHTIEQGGYVGS